MAAGAAALALVTPRHAAPFPAAAVDSVFAPYSAPGAPGAAVLVLERGRVLYERGYGLAVVEDSEPVTAHTDFRLASLTKQFTAMAVMLLAHDGRLSYDEPIRRLVPELPPWAAGVTLRELLNHTGGLPDYEDWIPAGDTAQVHDADVPRLIARAPGPYFPPGAEWRYSNTGYALLALAVERASGRRFADFLHDRIFAPLKMTGSVAYERGRSAVPHRAFGYTDTAGTWIRTDQSLTSAVLGDGGIYTSVADLARWYDALDRHVLLDSADYAPALEPPVLADGTRSQYGFGWFVDTWRGEPRVWHYGETIGFSTAVRRFPARGLTVVVLTNRNGRGAEPAADSVTAVLFRATSGN